MAKSRRPRGIPETGHTQPLQGGPARSVARETFFAEVVAGALAKRGFTPVLCTRTAEGVSEGDYVDILLDQDDSGVIHRLSFVVVCLHSRRLLWLTHR
jgi:hypothetical protein